MDINMKYILSFIFILIYAVACTAQPTFHGSATNPNDNSSAAATPLAVTPPASMVAGDLVVLWSMTRTTGATNDISVTGGQTWTPLTAGGTTDQTTRIFWCRYNGTWAADPSVSFTSAICVSVGMMVFRPTVGTKLWAVDQTLVNLPYTAPLTPFTVTVAGVTNAQPNTITVAFIASTDDNAYNSLTGSGWTAGWTGNIYRRNTAGSDQTHVGVYRRSAGTGASGNVSANQSSNAGDAGSTAIVSFYEYTAAATNRGIPLNMIVP